MPFLRKWAIGTCYARRFALLALAAWAPAHAQDLEAVAERYLRAQTYCEAGTRDPAAFVAALSLAALLAGAAFWAWLFARDLLTGLGALSVVTPTRGIRRSSW